MAVSTRSYARSFSNSGGLPNGIKWLLIINIGVFLLQSFGGETLGTVFSYLVLIPEAVVKLFFIWQPFTYMFLHGGIGHVLWNMLALWMFGTELERTWGTRRFLQFYLLCGTGAGVVVVIANYMFGNPGVATVGASGAIYGLLLASAMLWPDRMMLFNFLIPLKMKYYAMIVGALAFMGSFNLNSGVSEVAHLSGMLFGYLQLKQSGHRGSGVIQALQERYEAWRLARAKRRFRVYLNKHGSDKFGSDKFGSDKDSWKN